MHSVNFPNGPALTFLTINFIKFSAKKLYATHVKLASSFANMALYLELWLTQFSAIHKQQIIEKMGNNEFYSKHLCNKYIVIYLDSTDCTQNIIPKSKVKNCSQKKES